MPISKTDFVRGLQCEKMLWLDSHMPELKIIPPEVQARLDAGNEFGDNAMGIFGEFTETTTFREDGRLHFAAMLEKTRLLLENDTRVICEASFSWYGNFCAADILRKENEGYTLYEVKNTHAVRQEFITDLGFQRLIIRKCGVALQKSFLILRGDEPPEPLPPNPYDVQAEYVEHAGFRYKLVNVTKEAKTAEYTANQRIFELGKIKKKDALIPNVSVGKHCESPYRCWYFEYCHKP